LSETGLVDVGLHRLLITATRTGGNTAVEDPSGFYQTSASLIFTPIPEPGTAALLALGLAALSARPGAKGAG
jgi:hypothetical protein